MGKTYGVSLFLVLSAFSVLISADDLICNTASCQTTTTTTTEASKSNVTGKVHLTKIAAESLIIPNNKGSNATLNERNATLATGANSTLINATEADANDSDRGVKMPARSLQARLNAVALECQRTLGAQQEIMALLSSGALPTNEKQRCFLECVYKITGLLKDGKIDPDKALNLAEAKFYDEPEKLPGAKALIKKCAEEVKLEPGSTERCAFGRLIRSCIVTHGSEIFTYANKTVTIMTN